MRMELSKYLGNNSGGPCGCLMLNGTPMKKINKSLKLPSVFLFSHVLIYGLLSYFCFPVWKNRNLVISNIVIEGLAIAFWLIAASRDPGFIQKPEEFDFMNLMMLVDPIQLCPDCEIVRTPRSRHCGICNRCVERYDHHCPWLNTCIGVHNHSYFMIFITLLLASLIQVFVSILY
jgi:palmitoyltransferase ZDHHC13/17